MTRDEEIREAAGQVAIRDNKGQYAHGFLMQALREAFTEGAEWADGHPRWISVEDELPRCGLESRLQDYWQGVREHAAIAAMQGILCAPIVEGIDPNPSKEHIAELAVAQADALIEELKKK